ncbi:FAD-binding protein [Marinobacter sp. ELB17]|uniref:FAD-binding protein n=1 Tax=Marinobacter sp. ELB17 TaxID=270374 RepID=UPI0018DE1EE3|nr:FAD-binding protein [Marinobacter sp. ELB17]
MPAWPILLVSNELPNCRTRTGGIQTDTCSRVLSKNGSPIPGLYAAVEAAGFGGGGISGIRSLEGTFLSNCVLNGRRAAPATDLVWCYYRALQTE